MNKLNAVLCSIVSGICFFFWLLLTWCGWQVLLGPVPGMAVPLWLFGYLSAWSGVYTMREARMEWERGS